MAHPLVCGSGRAQGFHPEAVWKWPLEVPLAQNRLHNRCQWRSVSKLQSKSSVALLPPRWLTAQMAEMTPVARVAGVAGVAQALQASQAAQLVARAAHLAPKLPLETLLAALACLC